jgi:hypothetical protein
MQAPLKIGTSTAVVYQSTGMFEIASLKIESLSIGLIGIGE